MPPVICPKCREARQTEIIATGSKREAFCANCAYSWPYDVTICRCDVVPVPHLHQDPLPVCPHCGKRAQVTQPVRH